MRTVPILRRYQLALAVVLGLSGHACLQARITYYGVPGTEAPSYFDNRLVSPSNAPLPWPTRAREASFAPSASEGADGYSFDELLREAKTHAFIAVHDGAIVYERYFHGATPLTMLPCFSMSKTFATVLVLRAVSDGLIPSLERPVTEFVPELREKPRYDEVTLDFLLRMTSGIDFEEKSLDGAQFYYTTNLPKLMYSYPVSHPPGEHYQYGSINIQLLWAVLARRLGGETVTHYFERKVWEPIGATMAASWSLDSASSGVEKFASGFNASARDYARLGLLFLNGGTIAGRRVLPEKWIRRSLSLDPVAGLEQTSDGWVKRSRYQWYWTRDGRAYFAKGYNGQYVFVVPKKRAIFVRFGEGYGEVDWPALFLRLAEELGERK